MAKKKFINQLYRKNKSSRVTSKMLQEQSVNAILTDPENRTLWINGNPYGNAYIDRADNNYDNLSTSDNYDDIGTIHGEIFNDFDNNVAKGNYSHAEGKGTQTLNEGEHAEGKYNYSIKAEEVEIDEIDTDAKLSKGTISTIGIGTNNENRKNAFRVDNTGEVYIVGVDSTLPDGRKVSYDPCNYDGTKKTVETRSLQEVIQRLGTMQEVTYGELRSLIDNKRLIPGMQYRITNYASNNDAISEACKDIYKFAANQFDIVVVADSEDTLNKNARACHHDFEQDIKYKAENIINADPYINNEISEDDTFRYISYENYLVYKTLTNTEKQNYSETAREIYDKAIEATKDLERKKSYFDNNDIESWKLQYNYTNENSWQNNNFENEKILVNVEVETGKYQLREYIYETEIEDTIINGISYKYKWRLFRYQNSKENSYDFDTTDITNPITNVNMYTTKDGIEIYNTYYDNILLTQLLYPTKENTGELFFGLDNQLYRINNYNYNDSVTENIKSYLTNDIVLLNIEYNNETRNFIYSGETYYNGEKVYKWYEIDYISNENNIIGLENLNENTFNTSNCNIKIKKDTNGQYKTFILSKSLTPLKEFTDNNQEYITGEDKNENELSFIKDTYFKEYLTTPDTITNKSNYKAGYCDKSPNNSLYDLINIFQKNNSEDFNIHYNLTDEVYEYNNNGTYEYYSVWCVSDSMYGSQDVKILVGDINTDNDAPYKTQSQVIDFINSLKSKTYPEDIEYGNEIIGKLTDKLENNGWYIPTNIDGETKFYDINKNYRINTLVFNSIIFKYDANNISNIGVNRILSNQKGLIYNFSWLKDNNLSIPQNTEEFILFKNFYNSYKENFIEETELKLYFSENDSNNFNIYSDLYNNVYIYYTYSSNNILRYNNFNFINKYCKSQGTINYLCDEFNNECYYDFKNIKFKVNVPWYNQDVTSSTSIEITFEGDKIQITEQNKQPYDAYIEDLRNLSAQPNTNGEIYDFYYFYTFSTLGTGNIFDSSLKNNTNNNSILNINSDILVKNIFIDCEVNNNKIINSENIILYKSKFCNNVINNCTYEYSDFNIFNMLIYYGNITGSTAGGFDMPWGREVVGKVNFENNIINNSSNIQFLPNETNLNLDSLTPYDILNNKLYDYNNLQFIDTLNSAVLFDYTDESIKKIADKENTVIDVPNIKTYKNNEDNILNISHDNININSLENTNISSGNDTNITSINYTNISSDNDTFITSINDTSISSGNKSKILANKYVFLQGNENIGSTNTTSYINTETPTSNDNIHFQEEKPILSLNTIDKLSNTNFYSKIRNKLNFQYDFKGDNNTIGGQTYIGVGPSLIKVKNTNGEYVKWTNNDKIFQYSLYYSGTNLIKPEGFPEKLSYTKTIFATFNRDINNVDKNDITFKDNGKDYLGKYLSTTIESIHLKDDYAINNLINIYPSFWFPIMGWMQDVMYDVRFIFNCKYYLTYDIEYSSENNGSGTHSGEFDILTGIVNGFNNTDNYIKPDIWGRFFGILCVNSLSFIREGQKNTLKNNIADVINEINKKIKYYNGTNYNECKERYVKTVKLGIKVTFENIGGATVLSNSRCQWFTIPYLNIIDSSYINPIPTIGNITTIDPNSTEIYKCMWNILHTNDHPIEYSSQMEDSIKHIFNYNDLPDNKEKYLYNRLVAASNKEIKLTPANINNIFTATQQNKYLKTPITSKPTYDENNGVYVQLYNDSTLLSVKQKIQKDEENKDCYINLTFNNIGQPELLWYGAINDEQNSITLDDIKNNLTTLRETVDELNGNVPKLNNDVLTLDNTVAGLIADITALKVRVSALEK